MAAKSVQLTRHYVAPDRRVERETGVDIHKRAIKEFQPMLDTLKVQRTCLQCRQKYTPSENLISRKCWMHTGIVVPRRGSPIWNCCGYDSRTLGCTSAMHVWSEVSLEFRRKNFDTASVYVPREIFDLGLIPFSKEIVSNWGRPEPAPRQEYDDSDNDGKDQEVDHQQQLYYKIAQVAIDPAIDYDRIFQ